MLAPGLAADVAIFDPDTVIDRATFTDPHHYAEGMRTSQNGVVVVDDGRHGRPPGHVLRGPAGR